jgi:hypothetical protein
MTRELCERYSVLLKQMMVAFHAWADCKGSHDEWMAAYTKYIVLNSACRLLYRQITTAQ